MSHDSKKLKHQISNTNRTDAQNRQKFSRPPLRTLFTFETADSTFNRKTSSER